MERRDRHHGDRRWHQERRALADGRVTRWTKGVGLAALGLVGSLTAYFGLTAQHADGATSPSVARSASGSAGGRSTTGAGSPSSSGAPGGSPAPSAPDPSQPPSATSGAS